MTYKLPLLARLYVTTEALYARLKRDAGHFGLRVEPVPVTTDPLPTYDVYGREDRVEAFRGQGGYPCAYALGDVAILGERSSSIRPKDHGRHLAPKGSRAPTRDASSGGQHASRQYYLLSLDGEIVLGPYSVSPTYLPDGFECVPTGDEPLPTCAPFSRRTRRKPSSPDGERGQEIPGWTGPYPEYPVYGGEREGPNPDK